MEARVIPLKEVPMGKGKLNYGDMYIIALKNPGERGNRGDDLISKLEVLLQVKKAVKDGNERVLLSEEDWKLLRDCCDNIPWTSVEEEMRDFLVAVREAKKQKIDDPVPVKKEGDES